VSFIVISSATSTLSHFFPSFRKDSSSATHFVLETGLCYDAASPGSSGVRVAVPMRVGRGYPMPDPRSDPSLVPVEHGNFRHFFVLQPLAFFSHRTSSHSPERMVVYLLPVGFVLPVAESSSDPAAPCAGWHFQPVPATLLDVMHCAVPQVTASTLDSSSMASSAVLQFDVRNSALGSFKSPGSSRTLGWAGSIRER